MNAGASSNKSALQIATEGTLLGEDGRELKKGIWESCVYLGTDGFVYHIIAHQDKGSVRTRISGKRSVGEYLRWVDGLFNPGQVPGESNAVHYRAARKLRELI
jgi:hypothetical protein